MSIYSKIINSVIPALCFSLSGGNAGIPGKEIITLFAIAN